ncbi:tyrosine-type recombinase/integrase [Proteiniclasticum ruminis]|uniref:tyrosine-type recombinase/integrase n=1 Tax=Proteiniclasticum ruminis TaxID=398199 RepID=UPI0028A85C44|nr:site-specific integrase [Proteiniclasticum ruminis]
MAKKRVRANGEGSIFFDKNRGLYIAKIKIGNNPDTGKAVYKRFSSKSREIARQKMTDYLQQNPEYNPHADQSTLDIYIRKYLYTLKKPVVSAKTLQRYESIYHTHITETEKSKHICPFLYFPMGQIQSTQIRTWYSELSVSASTLKLIHIIINGALVLGMEDRVITYNPAHAISMKKEKLDEEDATAVLTAEEQRILVDALDLSNPVHRLLYFVLGTGLRLGEALALRWSDFKIINKEKHVQVKRSLSRVKMDDGTYQDIEGDPKTKASRRSIPLSAKLQQEIKSWDSKSKNGLVFTNPNRKEETYIFNKTPVRHLERLCKQKEITEVTVRGLRHSYATRHFEEGTSIKTVQKLLGHEKFETTMNIYTHVMPDIKIRDVKNIDKFL